MDHTDRLAGQIVTQLGLPLTSAAPLTGVVPLIYVYIVSRKDLRLQYLRTDGSKTTLVTCHCS